MLDRELEKYAACGAYPFHMPGHKRQLEWPNPYGMDITEIHGFDNLHHADGVLADLQKRAAKLYGAEKSYALVNGSTCGLLAAICAATGKGDRILMARNCHKSVYHAVQLNELRPIYIFSRKTRINFQGQIAADDVQEALERYPDVKAVIITSPTYDGIVSDIKRIASLVHQRDIPLIVDEAHGAHFGFADYLPENAVSLGADAAVVSVHKTLPALTQTALLHLCGKRIQPEKVEEYLDIFETSSPSYLLLAGIERCVRMVSEKRDVLFKGLRRNLDYFYREVSHLRCLHVLGASELTAEEAFAFDDSKIVILTGGSGLDGRALAGRLREEYGLEVEMACSSYVLALSTVMDTEEGFSRLAEALQSIDASCRDISKKREGDADCGGISHHGEKVMEPHEASRHSARLVALADSLGQVSAGYVIPYPPGIPLVVPGERLDRLVLQDILECKRAGVELEGMKAGDRIKVVNLG